MQDPVTPPAPRPIGPLAEAFDTYLKNVYGERAQILPMAQRNELEQAFMASAQWMLGAAVAPRRGDLLVRISKEIDAYAATRVAIVSLTGQTLSVRKS